MMVKFTNAFGLYAGMPLWINTDWIISVFEHRENESASVKTIVYGSHDGERWEIEESLNQAIKIINEAKK